MKRALYRFAHRFGWHHARTFWVEGDRHVKCEWCGLREVVRFDRLDISHWKPVATAAEIND